MSKKTIKNILQDELTDAVLEWKKSIDLLMIINGCGVDRLLGSGNRDLARIYKIAKQLERNV